MYQIDEIAVERATYGDPVPLSTAERTIAVARMTARGLSSREIAERLRRSRRTVHRYRAWIRRVVQEAA